MTDYPDTLPVTPVASPISGTIAVPGSKSITNRALLLAALAEGVTTLTNALFSDDTQRMMDCLRVLGFDVQDSPEREEIRVQGRGGDIPASEGELFVGNSGTTTRFIVPAMALGQGEFLVDGVARMRERPIGDLIRALQQLGVGIESVAGNDCPPLRVSARGLHGGTSTIRSDISSQFLSGLLMASPAAAGDETRILLEGPILSAPYIAITTAMMRQFGVSVDEKEGGREYRIPGRQTYRAQETYTVEPDASSASYFFAVAAITGGCVRVSGIGTNSLQGDAAFVDVLEKMGCRVNRGADFLEVQGAERLQGITVDMNAISDTVMTLAAVAPFAESPVIIENVAHIRHKETDRIAAVVTELRRLGVMVEEREDGMTIYPAGQITPAEIHTYDDHRMAMAFSLVGLIAPGIVIRDPGCVAKTFPDYFERLETLAAGSRVSDGE